MRARARQLVRNWRAEAERQEAKGHPKAASIWTHCANDLALAIKDDRRLSFSPPTAGREADPDDKPRTSTDQLNRELGIRT